MQRRAKAARTTAVAAWVRESNGVGHSLKLPVAIVIWSTVRTTTRAAKEVMRVGVAKEPWERS